VTLGIAAAGAALVGLLALAGRPLKERPQVGDHVIPSQPHHDFHARWAWCAEQADPCCKAVRTRPSTLSSDSALGT
jgi:hypothetical protein